MKTETETLTVEQHRALMTYATEHGRRWKFKLSVAWMNAAEPGVLQYLRNAIFFGPEGLQRYRLPTFEAVAWPNGLGFDVVNSRDGVIFGSVKTNDDGTREAVAIVDDWTTKVSDIPATQSALPTIAAFAIASEAGGRSRGKARRRRVTKQVQADRESERWKQPRKTPRRSPRR